MKHLVMGAALAAVAFTGCSEERVGSPAVYASIEASTDCADLQATFDRAADNNDRATPGTPQHQWTLGYMKAADERMEAVGCYG